MGKSSDTPKVAAIQVEEKELFFDDGYEATCTLNDGRTASARAYTKEWALGESIRRAKNK